MNFIELTILCLAGHTLLNPTACLITLPIIGVGLFALTYIHKEQ